MNQEAEDTPKPRKDPREKLFKPEHPFILSTSPHDYTRSSVPVIMWHVVGALLPAIVMGVYYFGIPALILIIACTVTALVTVGLLNILTHQPVPLADGSATITGLLLALTLPPGLPVSYAVLGTIFGIAIGKFVFERDGGNLLVRLKRYFNFIFGKLLETNI